MILILFFPFSFFFSPSFLLLTFVPYFLIKESEYEKLAQRTPNNRPCYGYSKFVTWNIVEDAMHSPRRQFDTLIFPRVNTAPIGTPASLQCHFLVFHLPPAT